MKLDFPLEGVADAVPDYRTLRALLDIRPFVAAAPATVLADAAVIAACSFTRSGLARLIAEGDHGKGAVNLRGSSFGEPGGVAVQQPGRSGPDAKQSVQDGSYA